MTSRVLKAHYIGKDTIPKIAICVFSVLKSAIDTGIGYSRRGRGVFEGIHEPMCSLVLSFFRYVTHRLLSQDTGFRPISVATLLPSRAVGILNYASDDRITVRCSPIPLVRFTQARKFSQCHGRILRFEEFHHPLSRHLYSAARVRI